MADQAHVDDILEKLGWWGKYQKIQVTFLMLPVIATAVHAMSVVFIGRFVDYKCAESSVPLYNSSVWTNHHVQRPNSSLYSNESIFTVEYGKCSVDVILNGTVVSSSTCNSYSYSLPADRTFVSEWDLVCEKEFLPDFSQTLFSLGQGFGASMFTALSDTYGRKPVYMIAHALLFGIAIAQAFVPTFTIFIVLKFFVGALQQGIGLTSSLMVVELLPTRRRSLGSQIGSFAWPGSLLLLCLFSYLTNEMSWRVSQLLYASVSFFVIFQWWINDETIRWLLANNRNKEAALILKKAANQNKTDVRKVMAVLEKTHIQMRSPIVKQGQLLGPGQNNDVSYEAEEILKAEAKEEKVGFSAFVKNRKILLVTAVNCYMWFADSLCYYGLLMASDSFVDDLYLGFTLNILSEIPAAAAFCFLIDRIGRKRCLFIFHIIGGVSLLIAVVLTNSFLAGFAFVKIIIAGVALVGRFGISVGFAVMWLYTPELFPTNLRNTGFGIASFAARVGGMLAPFSRTLGRHLPWAPGVVFTLLCFGVCFLTKLLPETHGRELPQTVEDLNKWFSKKEAKTNGVKQHVHNQDKGHGKYSTQPRFMVCTQ